MARDRAANKPDITPPIMMNCFANISRVSLISFTQKPAALSSTPGCVQAVCARKHVLIFRLKDIYLSPCYYLTSYHIISSKQVWKLNFRQCGEMEMAQPGRNSDVEKVSREKIRDGEDQRWRKSEERRCRCAKR